MTGLTREVWKKEHQRFEARWWTERVDTFGEEHKQVMLYAPLMGLGAVVDGGRWPIFDLDGLSVVDIGGGPVSLLLKTRTTGRRLVVEPCDYPEWVWARYAAEGIEVARTPAEDWIVDPVDEAWCYNVLQHTLRPWDVVAKMRESASLIRIFEWIDLPPHRGHPHELKADELRSWIGGEALWEPHVGEVTEDILGARHVPGRAFAGAFRV